MSSARREPLRGLYCPHWFEITRKYMRMYKYMSYLLPRSTGFVHVLHSKSLYAPSSISDDASRNV